MEIQGQFDEKFAPVIEEFQRNFEERGDVGASFAATIEGEFVIDVWAGHRDAAGTEPWLEDTIVNVYSTTKTMAALSALVLADRGEIDFNEKVSAYWPEFAQNGKENVEVRHCMAHMAGLSGMEKQVTNEQFYDWDTVVRLLAEQAPWWEPGTASGYHAMTQGHLIGEVVRRVTGKSIGQYFAEEIAGPLQADFHIGTKEAHWPRIGELIPPSDAPAVAGDDPDSVASKTFRSPAPNAKDSATPGWRLAEIPAANGHGNARSVVRAQTPLANEGSAFGVDLLSKAGAERIFEEQCYGQDLVLGVPMRFGMGYGLNGNEVPMGPNERIGYWGGWGGSTIVVDADARLCVSYVMNRMLPSVLGDPRGYKLLQTIYEVI